MTAPPKAPAVPQDDPAAPLYDPAEHRPLTGDPFTETRARAEIERIAEATIADYGGPERLWPNHPNDLEPGDADVPYRNVYLGAAGVIWALHVLSCDGLAPALPGAEELAGELPAAYRAAPEFTELADPPAPSLLFGVSGLLLVAATLATDPEATAAADAQLAQLAGANVRHPSRELCWGSPGTMIAALHRYRATGDVRLRDAYIDSAQWLLEQWDESLWEQDLYGRRQRLIGAGHGFAGTAFALLAGADLLAGANPATSATPAEPDPANTKSTIAIRAATTLAAHALEQDGLAQWPPAPGATNREPIQWCHGSPGIVISLAGLPADPATDRLLTGGGELTWQAGPLRKGVGLCHGTAGNAFAFLALYRRTHEERWLDRARRFAMDAAAHTTRRHTLFTGDLAVALLLRACLDPEKAGFPLLEAI